MPEHLQNGGVVSLWAGWSVTLPPSYHQRNEDGSFSAWGDEWTVDVHIIEVGGTKTGEPSSPVELLGASKVVNVTGSGWVGSTELLQEKDEEKQVFRLAANLAAVNTLLSYWVSYFNEQQHDFAANLVGGVAHHTGSVA